MTQQDLLNSVSEWLSIHINPYDRHTNELAWWQIDEIKRLLETEEVSKQTLKLLINTYNRWKYHY